jgi:hypothetical protein
MHLDHCMRPDVPRAAAKAAAIGDIQYASQGPESKSIATMFFSRGNLQVSVRSVGSRAVDVTKFARSLDARFIKPVTKAEAKAGVARALKPETVAVRKGEAAALVEQLPEPISRSGCLRVIVPDGELRREGDVLYYSSDKAGRKSVEVVNLALE